MSSCSVFDQNGPITRRPSSRGRGKEFLCRHPLDAAHHPDDVGDAHPASLPRQAIAAARSAHASQDTGTDQLLHDLFQIAPRQIQATGDVLTLHRFDPAVIGDVGDRLQGEHQLLRWPQHLDKSRALGLSGHS